MSSLTSSSSFPVNPVPSAATDMVNETHRQAISPPPNTSANTYYQPDEKIYNSKECILTSSKPIAYAIPSSDLEKANQIVRIHHHVISCKHQEDADAATGKKTISTNKFFPIRRAQSFKTLSYEEKVNPLVRIPSRRAPNVMSMEQLSERIPFIVNSTPNIHIAFSKESPVSIIEETSESSFVRRKYLINKNISVVEDNVFGQVLRLVANKDLLTYMKCEDEASLEMRQRMLEFLIVIEKKHSDIFIDPNLKRSEKYNGIIYKGRIPNMEEVRAVESNKYALKIINQRLNLFGDQPSSSTATPSTGGSMVDWERLNEVLIPTYEYSIPSVEYCLDFLRTVIIYRKFIHRDICIKKMSRDMNKEERFVYDVALTTENNFNRDSARLEKEIMVMIDIYNEFKDVPDTRVRHSFCPGLDREVYRRIDLECQQQEIQRIQAERLEREQRNFQNTVASATLFNMLNTGGETVQEMLEDLLPPEIKNRDITPLCGPYRNDRFNSAYHMKTIAERLMDDAEITPDMIISNFQTYNRPQILNDDVQIEYYEMVLCPKGLLGIHKCKLIDEETNLPTWCGRRFRFKMYYNRLSMAELFDKNKHIYSCFFDALVACVISIAALVLVKREIFTDHDDGKEEEGSDGNMIEMQPFARTRSDQHNVNLGINKKCKSTHFANILKIYWIRFQHDIFAFFFITIFFFGLHRTAIFNTEKVFIERLFCILGIVFGFCNHYFYPSLRMKNPWGIFRDPLLKSKEYDVFESQNQTPVAYYETIHIWMLYFERNIIYPCLIISLCSNYAWEHPLYPPIVTAFAAFKLCRTAYSQPNTLYCPLFYTYICINFDLKAYPAAAQCRLLVFFILTILWIKLKEFILKASFIFTYNAPWQITWGSAFHAFVQPLSVAHSGLTMILVAFSSIISAPLNPFLGSALILISYPRPVKFWEKNYSSENKEDRRPVADLAKSPVTNESNLNGVFYEHLSRQLQTYLAGDVLMGRWGTKVEQGDFFVLASLNLNCLVHIIEKGNGFITFQVRGLEFHGTYCQQREVEAISDDPNINDACYCWNANCFPACLNFRAACNVRWSAWQVAAAKYVIDGYSVTDNSVIGILNSVEYRRIFITLIVKCFIFYTFNSGKLAEWMQDSKIKEDLELKSDPKFIENDSNHFSASFDQDYDKRKIGVTRAIFTAMYKKWIRYVKKQTEEVFYSKDLKVIADHSTLITLCFSISIAGRRILAATSYSNISNITESLLYGIHSLLKEDVQVDNKNDAWVLHDKDFVEQVFSPSVRLALKLLQDYFKELDDFDNISVLYERILSYKDRIFISHEHDPKWRSAIMSNVPSLLTIRQVYEDGQNDYKLIMLNKMFLNMRVIKINRECVRAFWAGQQQELIFMKNRNPERGSIQNAKQVLRNMINSSADQPVGYPIYVSPLTTSYIESHNQFKGIIDKSFTINTIFTFFRNLFESITSKILNSSSRNVNNSNTNVNSARYQGNEVNISLNTTTRRSSIKHDIEAGEHVISARAEQNSSQSSAKSTIRNNSFANENVVLRVLPGDESNSANKVYHCIETNPSATHSKSIIVETLQDHQIPHAKKKQSSCSSTGTDEISKEIHNEMVGKYAMIKDQNFIFKTLNEKIKALNRYLVTWPEEEWRLKGGTTGWEYFPKNRAYGQIVHVWVPFHLEPLYRSHAGTIYLIKIVDEQPSDDPLNSRKLSISLNISEKVMYVPINAEGAQIITNIEEYKKIVEEEAKQLPTEDEPTISIIESTTPSLVSVKYVKEKPSIVLRSSNESGFPKISAVTSLTPLSENSDVTINMPQEEKDEEGKS
uniref:Pecanex-like protein n=1 Tax=Rhabditophanes sp. KR3021 TaxID=114890 RepID=A0AC35U6K7_9BILA